MFRACTFWMYSWTGINSVVFVPNAIHYRLNQKHHQLRSLGEKIKWWNAASLISHALRVLGLSLCDVSKSKSPRISRKHVPYEDGGGNFALTWVWQENYMRRRCFPRYSSASWSSVCKAPDQFVISIYLFTTLSGLSGRREYNTLAQTFFFKFGSCTKRIKNIWHYTT